MRTRERPMLADLTNADQRVDQRAAVSSSTAPACCAPPPPREGRTPSPPPSGAAPARKHSPWTNPRQRKKGCARAGGLLRRPTIDERGEYPCLVFRRRDVPALFHPTGVFPRGRSRSPTPPSTVCLSILVVYCRGFLSGSCPGPAACVVLIRGESNTYLTASWANPLSPPNPQRLQPPSCSRVAYTGSCII